AGSVAPGRTARCSAIMRWSDRQARHRRRPENGPPQGRGTMRRMMRWIAAAALWTALLSPARAQDVQVEAIKVHGASLEGNLEGNSADRDVFVVLPPSYASGPQRRYQVVYFLHGFLATARNYM